MTAGPGGKYALTIWASAGSGLMTLVMLGMTAERGPLYLSRGGPLQRFDSCVYLSTPTLALSPLSLVLMGTGALSACSGCGAATMVLHALVFVLADFALGVDSYCAYTIARRSAWDGGDIGNPVLLSLWVMWGARLLCHVAIVYATVDVQLADKPADGHANDVNCDGEDDNCVYSGCAPGAGKGGAGAPLPLAGNLSHVVATHAGELVAAALFALLPFYRVVPKAVDEAIPWVVTALTCILAIYAISKGEDVAREPGRYFLWVGVLLLCAAGCVVREVFLVARRALVLPLLRAAICNGMYDDECDSAGLPLE